LAAPAAALAALAAPLAAAFFIDLALEADLPAARLALAERLLDADADLLLIDLAIYI
jgi:hypothetical protein